MMGVSASGVNDEWGTRPGRTSCADRASGAIRVKTPRTLKERRPPKATTAGTGPGPGWGETPWWSSTWSRRLLAERPDFLHAAIRRGRRGARNDTADARRSPLAAGRLARPSRPIFPYVRILPNFRAPFLTAKVVPVALPTSRVLSSCSPGQRSRPVGRCPAIISLSA